MDCEVWIAGHQLSINDGPLTTDKLHASTAGEAKYVVTAARERPPAINVDMLAWNASFRAIMLEGRRE